MRLAFKDYVQPKDAMTIDVDAKAALLSAIHVATYLEKPEDTVTLDVRFSTLADGTSYTSQTTLEAKAKNIRVVVENSGHRPMAKKPLGGWCCGARRSIGGKSRSLRASISGN